jgi:putative transposase
MPRWKNISLEGYAYFITTKIKDYIKVFETKPYFDIIIENLNFYRKKFGFKLWGYVIMPEHIHLMIYLTGKNNLSKIMEEFKRFTSKQILKQLQAEKRLDLIKLFTIPTPKKEKHMVWEEGFKGLGIRSEKVFNIKMNYIHYNPVKRGLVEKPEDYIYSSYRNYYCQDNSIIELDPIF